MSGAFGLVEEQTRTSSDRRTSGAAAPEPGFDEVAAIACGHTASRLLWAGVQLGVFKLLSGSGPLTRQQLAARLRLKPHPARVLLQGLTALRLLKKRDQRYANAPIVEKTLVPGRPGSVIPILGWQHEIVYPGLMDFTESLRQNRNVGLKRFPGRGATLYARLRGHADLNKIFHEALSCLSRQANRQLIETLDLGDSTHLLDVGGGDGTNATAFVRRHPGLRATVFDLPSACAVASRKIARAGIENRVSTVAGDFFRDPFPAGVDAILLGHLLTIWSPERNRALLGKCHRALPANGKVVVFNMMANDDDTGPLMCALGSPYFQAIATGEGMLYAWHEYEAWLQDAGFTVLSRRGLPMEHGLIVAEK